MLSGSLLGGALVGFDRGLPFYVVGIANVGSAVMALMLLRRGVGGRDLPKQAAAATGR